MEGEALLKELLERIQRVEQKLDAHLKEKHVLSVPVDFVNATGQLCLRIGQTSEGAYLHIFDSEGYPAVQLGCTSEGGFVDINSTPELLSMISMSIVGKSGVIEFYDPNVVQSKELKFDNIK